MSDTYIDSLKKIREAEQVTERELQERRSQLEKELEAARQIAAKEIQEAEAKAAQLIEEEVSRARTSAEAEAEKILEEFRRRAGELQSRRWDRKRLKQLAEEILFSEFRGR